MWYHMVPLGGNGLRLGLTRNLEKIQFKFIRKIFCTLQQLKP